SASADRRSQESFCAPVAVRRPRSAARARRPSSTQYACRSGCSGAVFIRCFQWTFFPVPGGRNRTKSTQLPPCANWSLRPDGNPWVIVADRGARAGGGERGGG